MRRALYAALLLSLLLISFAAADDSPSYPYAYSKNVFREQMRLRFIYPEQYVPKDIVSDGSFIRGQQRNVVLIPNKLPPKQPHVRPELYKGSENIPYPTPRKGIFDRDLEYDQRRFFQTNAYIKDYQRRVRKEPRQFKQVPVYTNIGERMGIIRSADLPPTVAKVSVEVTEPLTTA